MVASPAVDLLLAVGVARRWWRRPRRYSQLSLSLASALDLEPATTAGAATAKRYNKRSFIGRDEEGDDGCCYGFSMIKRWCSVQGERVAKLPWTGVDEKLWVRRMIKVMTISLLARFGFDSTTIDIELNQKFDLLNKEWRRTAIISN